MPSASVTAAVTAKTGLFRRVRAAYASSLNSISLSSRDLAKNTALNRRKFPSRRQRQLAAERNFAVRCNNISLMTRARLTLGAASGVIVFILACHRSSRTRTDLLDMPAEKAQQTLAMDAVHKLRDDLNTGACQSIYDRAADFFRSQPAEDWAIQCEHLEEKLGNWRSFHISYTERCAGSGLVICIGGSADFANGRKEMSVAWLLENRRAQLYWIALKQDQSHWMYIPSLQDDRRLIASQDPLLSPLFRTSFKLTHQDPYPRFRPIGSSSISNNRSNFVPA